MADAILTFAEAMTALAKGERVEALHEGGFNRSPRWSEIRLVDGRFVLDLREGSAAPRMIDFRLVPRKTRIQEMAEEFKQEFQGATHAEFGERVVREVCVRLRAYHEQLAGSAHQGMMTLESVARFIEREFLGPPK